MINRDNKNINQTIVQLFNSNTYFPFLLHIVIRIFYIVYIYIKENFNNTYIEFIVLYINTNSSKHIEYIYSNNNAKCCICMFHTF